MAVVRSAVREEERNAPLVPASVEDTACGPAPEQAVLLLFYIKKLKDYFKWA